MYNDYSMVTAGLADPFQPQKQEKSDKCNFVVSYIGKNEPKFEMNNPHYMREFQDLILIVFPLLFLIKSQYKINFNGTRRFKIHQTCVKKKNF